MKSRDKLKPLYLYYQSAYGHQNKVMWCFHYHSAYGHHACENSDIPWGAPNHKIISRGLPRSYDKQKKYNYTTRVYMVTRLGRMITYLDGLLPIKAHDPLIKWFCKIMRLTKTIVSRITWWIRSPNLVGWWHTLSDSHTESYSKLWSRDLVRSRDKL